MLTRNYPQTNIKFKQSMNHNRSELKAKLSTVKFNWMQNADTDELISNG